MKTYAEVKDGIVVNSVLSEPAYAAAQGWIEMPLGPNIGWSYSDGVFSPPPDLPPVIPDEVSAAQAKTALYRKSPDGSFYAAVEAALGGSTYGLVRIWWSSAQVWRRDHPYILGMAAELGLDDDDVDALFIAAAAVPT